MRVTTDSESEVSSEELAAAADDIAPLQIHAPLLKFDENVQAVAPLSPRRNAKAVEDDVQVFDAVEPSNGTTKRGTTVPRKTVPKKSAAEVDIPESSAPNTRKRKSPVQDSGAKKEEGMMETAMPAKRARKPAIKEEDAVDAGIKDTENDEKIDGKKKKKKKDKSEVIKKW